MGKPEYDSFFYKGHVVELADALDFEQSNLLAQYNRDSLYCPECYAAKLKFTTKTSRRKAFLSTKQGSVYDRNLHLDNCSHAVKKASKSQVKEYYNTLTDGQIQDKLDAAINAFLRKHDGEVIEHQTPKLENNPSIATTTEHGHQVHRRLPKRSIYSIYDVEDDELNIPLMIYGTVCLSVEQRPSKFNSNKHYYEFRLISTKSGKIIRRIHAKSLPQTVDVDAIYYFTAIVVIWKGEDGKLKSKLFDSKYPSLKYVRADY